MESVEKYKYFQQLLTILEIKPLQGKDVWEISVSYKDKERVSITSSWLGVRFISQKGQDGLPSTWAITICDLNK